MDAEGYLEQVPCPVCGSRNTVTYHYAEGFSELECPDCQYRSDADELAKLQHFVGDILEGEGPRSAPPPIPVKGLKA